MRARGALVVAALLGGPAAFLAVAYAVPLQATLAAADLAAWRWALEHPLVHKTLWQATLQAGLSTLLSLALALPLAWHHHRRRIPFGRLQLAVHAAPFVLPVFVIVFGIQAVMGRGGWTDRALGIDVLGWLGPLGAIVIAHAYYNYGFAARLLHAALERRPHTLEDAAMVLGASRWRAVLRTTWPLLMPSVLSVALLVFLFTFTSFGVVLYLGEGQWHTLETMLYERLRGAFPQRDRAAVLGIIQLLANFALLAAYSVLIRRQVRLPREVPRALPALRRHRWVSWAVVVAAVMPAFAVLVGGFQVRGRWSLEPWRALLDNAHPAHRPGFDLGHALQLTLLYAVAAAAIAILLTLLLTYGLRRMHPKARALAEVLAALPLGTSSLLIGFGVLLAYGVSAFVDPARGRMMIIAAHALVAFPFTARALLPAIEQHDRRLDEAAATTGAGPWSTWWRVQAPLLRPPLLAALGIAMAMSIGDFGASLLLMGPENMSISIWIDRHGGVGNFNPLQRAQAVALAGLLMVLTTAAYVAVEAVDVRGLRGVVDVRGLRARAVSGRADAASPDGRGLLRADEASSQARSASRKQGGQAPGPTGATRSQHDGQGPGRAGEDR